MVLITKSRLTKQMENARYCIEMPGLGSQNLLPASSI